jgi:hypothetical protein
VITRGKKTRKCGGIKKRRCKVEENVKDEKRGGME